MGDATGPRLQPFRRSRRARPQFPLVPMALALGLTGFVAFLWSLRAGQYDDLDGAALRILTDDDVSTGAAPDREGH
jgi:cbb3-type cytochrome oxidase maturation protein